MPQASRAPLLSRRSSITSATARSSKVEISSCYAWIHQRQPACFKWAAMAAIASHHIQLALFPLRLDAERTGFVDIPHSLAGNCCCRRTWTPPASCRVRRPAARPGSSATAERVGRPLAGGPPPGVHR